MKLAPENANDNHDRSHHVSAQHRTENSCEGHAVTHRGCPHRLLLSAHKRAEVVPVKHASGCGDDVIDILDGMSGREVYMG